MFPPRSIFNVSSITCFSSWSKFPIGSRKGLRKKPIRPTPNLPQIPTPLFEPQKRQSSNFGYINEAERSRKKSNQSLLRLFGNFENCPICNTSLTLKNLSFPSNDRSLISPMPLPSTYREDQQKEKFIPLTPKQVQSFIMIVD